MPHGRKVLGRSAQSWPRAGRRRAPAFTLLELLVVVAVFALLMALLAPALSNARRSGYAMHCAANLRQLGIGWSIYADTNEGTVVAGRPGKFANNELNVYWVGNGYQWRPRWFVRMGAECGFYAFREPSPLSTDDNLLTVVYNSVFVCRAAADRTNNRNYTYGYNFQFLGNTRFAGGAEANGFINHPVKLNRLRTADTVLAADALGTAAGKPADARTPYRVDGGSDLFAVGNHAWSLDPPRLTATSDFCDDANRAPEHRSAPEMRHGGRSNTLFCDGHVEATDYAALGYLVNADGSIPANGPGAHNRLFSGSGRDDDPPSIK